MTEVVNTAEAGADTSSTDGSAVIDPNANQQDPNGSEADNNSGKGDEAMVPSHRVREATEARRAAEAEVDTLKQELADLQATKSASKDDDDIDPEVQTLVTKILEKGGYVKKGDVDQAVQATEARRQYNEDTRELTTLYAKSGVPFKAEDIRKYAADNGLNITNKLSLDAAYKAMNFDKIVESKTNAAIVAAKENGNASSAEKPGSKGAEIPPDKEVTGLKNRIAAARARLAK
jgi:hypothetical protein